MEKVLDKLITAFDLIHVHLQFECLGRILDLDQHTLLHANVIIFTYIVFYLFKTIIDMYQNSIKQKLLIRIGDVKHRNHTSFHGKLTKRFYGNHSS